MRPLGESRSGRASRCASRLSRCLRPSLRMHAAQSCGGRSAFHRRTNINPRAKAIHHAPQQGLPRQGTHDQEPLDLLQPQAGLPRPLVELRPRRALLQQFGYRHGRPPRQRRPGTRQDAEEMTSADGNECEIAHIADFFLGSPRPLPATLKSPHSHGILAYSVGAGPDARSGGLPQPGREFAADSPQTVLIAKMESI